MRGLIHGLLAAGVLLGIPGTVLAAEGAPAVDTGDTAWVLISAALVMLMTPGLAFFYGGMVRSKNVLTTIMQSFFIVAMVSVQWVLFGFSLAFGPDINGVIGSLSWAGLTDTALFAAPYEDYSATVPLFAFAAFQCMFAVITAALITGAYAERFKFGAFVLFTFLWTTFLYDPMAHWVWGVGGWLRDLGALDFAGGTVIHISDHEPCGIRIFADDPEEGLVSFPEMLRIRRVVVVVHDEDGKVQVADGFRQRKFSAGGTGESEIDLFRVDLPAEHGGISVSRTRCASALGDGGTVEEDWFRNPVRGRRFDERPRIHTDLQSPDSAVKRKIEHPFLHAGVVIGNQEDFEKLLIPVRLSAGNVEFFRSSSAEEVESGASGSRHVVHVEGEYQFCTDGDCPCVGPETDGSSAGMLRKIQLSLIHLLQKAAYRTEIL